MNFSLNESLEILERTPKTLEQFLVGLSDGWLQSTEGEGSWNPAQVVDHLVECERSNWIPRLQTMFEGEEENTFPSFDRDAHLTNPPATSIEEKIHSFIYLRSKNIKTVREWVTSDEEFELKGKHPAFGEVKLRELLSTWVVHDLTHISQIMRVMAERYREDVGPWEAYLGVLKRSK